MRYSIGMLMYGLLFSAPGWAIAAFNVGHPAMWAGLTAGTIAYLPFLASSFFPDTVQAALRHE